MSKDQQITDLKLTVERQKNLIGRQKAIIRRHEQLNPNSNIMQQVKNLTIRLVMEQVKGNRAKAAALLGIGERTLYRKIKDMQPKGDSPPADASCKTCSMQDNCGGDEACSCWTGKVTLCEQ